MGCLWSGKYSRQCKTMPSGPPEFIPPFVPVTGMKCSYGKIYSPLTEISATEPARPPIWTHGKFYKGFRGEARSREPSQPALSYEHIENFTKDLQVKRDLGNRASPVNRAHMKRPSEANEGERNNCFSKIQLVGQKYRDKTTLASKTRFSRHCTFWFSKPAFFATSGYNISPSSSSTDQNAALIMDH